MENIKIFGCKVNKYFANQRYNFLKSKKKIGPNDVLLASCVVTDRAKKKFVKEVKDLCIQGKKVFLTGCGAFEKGKEMDYNKFYKLYPQLIDFQDKIELLAENPYFDQQKKFGFDVFSGNYLTTRKFVIIQTGCDSFCTFCLTVHKRGNHQSRPWEEIVEEINDFENSGGKEIVLTGVNLCAWGAETTTKPQTSQFSFLLKKIIENTNIERIRISSLGPEFLDEDFFEIISNPRFLPYFHFSFQSFSNKVLQGMRRNYDSNLLQSHIDKIYNAKGFLTNIGGDIIVGFPKESSEDFQKTLDMVEKNKLTQIHAFPFSSHEIGETIPAGHFDGQISSEIKKYRMKKIQDLIKKNKTDLIQKTVGKTMSILIEQEKNGLRVGWTENYLQVGLVGDYKANQIIKKELGFQNFLPI